MPRIARVVAPGFPHHITQRGNRRQPTFFCDEDYLLYLDLIGSWCEQHEVKIWAYCLMPNHVHLIVVPHTEDGLRRGIGEAHRRYTRSINFRMGWRGHLWQGRFASFPMDENYLLAAIRYVELNPVHAKLAVTPGSYPWSSAAAHLGQIEDPLISDSPLPKMVDNWESFLKGGLNDKELKKLQQAERTGRPLGSDSFVENLEAYLGRMLHREKPGPKASN